METLEGIEVLKVTSAAQWREWLASRGTARAVWLVIRRKHSGRPGVLVHEAMEQALCFGWIDSKALRRDAESTYLCFTPRNPKSTWSRVNRERVARLTSAGLMTPSGQAMVDLARRTGTWDALAEAQDGIVPPDLAQAFDDVAAAHFAAFPPSSKRLILEWIAKAKRPETRQRRITTTVELARENVRAAHPKAA
ncbi:YdeI/OmpD-associated family protein [Amycolatopsis sp., V23-08]|uniref:YdeI/OmpD-associated family protein n=1 Tax=Amycolatopsis heterodermiae TaxID=3110235 RepID=A0ABU5QVQ4_9PSEU|nr:YdeI/OmpD-associated family protein [Amycolatopsis sp., V23-08]MEA5357933.1 YdeI/OmpD-associated family protein [Amycolatopsis sp., V23-08]